MILKLKKNQKGLSLFDIILALIVVGYGGYFAMQFYFKWSESLHWAEAADQLKSIKRQIELCIVAKPGMTGIDNCILNPTVQGANIMNFKCCDAINNTISPEKISYMIYATRNDHDLSINDSGGDQPVCEQEGKTTVRLQSGIQLCRNFDGTYTLEGWGIYKGTYR